MIIIGILFVVVALFMLLTFGGLWVSSYSSSELREMGMSLGYADEEVKPRVVSVTRKRSHKPTGQINASSLHSA